MVASSHRVLPYHSDSYFRLSRVAVALLLLRSTILIGYEPGITLIPAPQHRRTPDPPSLYHPTRFYGTRDSPDKWYNGP